MVQTMAELGRQLHAQGKFNRAEPLCREAMQWCRETLGPRNPQTLSSIDNYAVLLNEQRNLTGAKPLYCVALQGRRETLGPRHPDTLSSISNYAVLLEKQGNLI